MPRRTLHVYILASASRNLYAGATADIARRMAEHRAGLCEYTRRYRITRLAYAEATADARAAIAREKQIKAYRRAKKIALVEAANPGWDELLG